MNSEAKHKNDEIADRRERVTKKFQNLSTEELENISQNYNWDDGYAIPVAIVRSPNCDLGTALRLYWRAGAQWLTQYSDISEVRDLDLEAWDFCLEVEGRVENRFYTRANVIFDARSDDGSDHTADYLGLPQHRKIPDNMFQPFPAPVPFSAQLLHEAIQSGMTLPKNRRISGAMSYLKRRIVAGSDMKHIHSLVAQHLEHLP